MLTTRFYWIHDIFWLVVFSMRLPYTQSFTCSFLGIWKVFRRYKSGPSFIYVLFVVSKFSNFKCFCTRRKCHLRLLLGLFFGDNPWNVVKFILNFCLPMQCKVMHQILTIVILFQRNGKYWAEKGFLAHFRGFLFMLLHPMSYDPIFCQMKGLMEIHNRGKFH